MRSLCYTFLTLLLYLGAFAQTDTLHIFFGTDISSPNKKSLSFLQKNMDSLKTSSFFLIIGYADERGDVYYNDMLSMRRSQNVASLLEKNGIDKNNIHLISGKGEVDRGNNISEIYKTDRRVDIVISNSKKITRRSERDTTGMPGLEEQLMSTPVGKSVILNNIYFFLSSAKPTIGSFPTMEDLLSTMKNNPGLYIQLEGHVCCVTPNNEREKRGAINLSFARSETLKEFLVKSGVDAGRISVMGFGRDRPLVPVELTEFDKQKNRRVEVRVIKK